MTTINTESLHAAYCKITRLPVRFTMSHHFCWERWLAEKYTEEDLKLVVAHLRRTASKERLPWMLAYRHLIQNTDHFNEYLAMAKAASRVPPVTPKQRILAADHRTPPDPDRTQKAAEVLEKAAKLSAYLKAWREQQEQKPL